MIYGVRVAVSKTLSSGHKSLAWDLIEVYDTLLRKYGIDLVSWSIDDKDDHFVIVGMVPGDYRPELVSAKQEIKEAIADIADRVDDGGDEIY